MNILLIDDEEDILEVLEMALEMLGDFKISKVSSGNLAIEKLKLSAFDLVICDYNMNDGNGGDVYRFLLDSNTETKYVLCSSEDPERHEVFFDRRLFFFHIEKPSIMGGVKNCIEKMRNSHIAIPPRCHDYIPVSIKLLYKLDFLPTDIYLKVTSEKYLKVLHENETFDGVDFVKYVQKNIFKLYVFSDHALLLQNKLEADVISDLGRLTQEANLGRKATGLLTAHDQIISLLSEYGLNENIKYAAEQSYLIAQDMVQGSSELQMLFNKILNEPSSYLSKHSLLLSVFTPLLVDKLRWSNTIMNKKLVAASLFHDIALKEDLNESVYQLTGKQSEDFKIHSQVAAEMISKISSVPHQTDIIILEHHEVGQEFGFPRGIPYTRVSPLGLVLSFSHYFVDYLLEYGSVPKALEQMKKVADKCSQYRYFYQALCEIKLM